MTMISSLRRAAGAALLLGLVAAPALAQAPDDFRIDDAWKAALEGNEGILNDKQMAGVNAMAYAAAAALLCDGIDIDADKVAATTTSILADGPKDLSDDEELDRYTNIMLIMGTAKGIFLSEGALHKADFCAAASKQKTDAPAETFWK